jgi:hypothetical protein
MQMMFKRIPGRTRKGGGALVAFKEKLNCDLHLSVVQFELNASER